ncbi:MAG: hypothetical protein FJY29_10205 [Betaproteobacteria bacterium]|nr:hypothetical protein [Betaproteobacteria bacterium]
MKIFLSSRRKSAVPLLTALLVSVASGIAAFAQSDFSHLSLSRVESELRGQVQQLKKHSDPWARSARSRAEFALFELEKARLASNPAVENMHLRHACEALSAERAILIEAQSADSGRSHVIETLIEQTFAHREIVGCLD